MCLEDEWRKEYIRLENEKTKKLEEDLKKAIITMFATPDEKCKTTFWSWSKDLWKGYCGCSSGYQFNTDKTSCIVIPKATKSTTTKTTTKQSTTTTKNYYKAKVCKPETTKKNWLCYCKTWYKLSKSWKACVK